ncbi:hypothetical protein DAMNIGENAA_32450 [Desulforhabdus amnigena]|jgi:hypothetical protein|uniref:Uncharacterized protein n=1 Tax=Desulforhabdus amnigena TaxID=40218 RepID=A0A9W6FVW2_9BACT|nr:hypothetical protein DAMNIGENAA_32450 [Desulforhabdus amnigena]
MLDARERILPLAVEEFSVSDVTQYWKAIEKRFHIEACFYGEVRHKSWQYVFDWPVVEEKRDLFTALW